MEKKLIVPFVFCINENLENYIWIFCKYADFCLKTDMPIIVEEEYYNDKELIQSYYTGWNPEDRYYTANSPKEEDIRKQLKAVLITKEDKAHLVEATELSKDRRHFCCEEDRNFEQLIDKKISEVKLAYGDIAAILTWIHYPALVNSAKKYGIRVIAQELSSIRGMDYYQAVYGYFNFESKYSSKSVKAELVELIDSLDQELILSRKEILTLVLQTQHLDILNRMDESMYEFGVDVDAERDFFFEKYADISWKKVLVDLDLMTDSSNVLARFHPSSLKKNIKEQFDIDESPNSMEWILKCRRIVSGISNVGFEAMLLGRTAYVLSPNIPFFYGNIHSLSCFEECVAEVKVLNYLCFAYFAPWELMFDYNYIIWRLSGPKPIEIYRTNLSFLLGEIDLNYQDALKMSRKERFAYILKHKHNLNEEQIKLYTHRQKNKTYSTLEEDYSKYKTEIKKKLEGISMCMRERDKEIEQMQNSTSWKLTKPLRSMGNFIRKI